MKKIYFCFVLFVAGIACNEKKNDELNRHPAHIHYSKHAECRMECRHINDSEVKEILENGKINYGKSDLNEDACHKRYAVEGYSQSNQDIRIIVAQCNDDLTVITVIDLGRDWTCDCD